ncbi:hypothetical protein DFH06DRAFT_1132519 [Mycena polygramma]|nr:hypothetical protein DFH06DRAFT_1132519 [Mycena polygramma]
MATGVQLRRESRSGGNHPLVQNLDLSTSSVDLQSVGGPTGKPPMWSAETQLLQTPKSTPRMVADGCQNLHAQWTDLGKHVRTRWEHNLFIAHDLSGLPKPTTYPNPTSIGVLYANYQESYQHTGLSKLSPVIPEAVGEENRNGTHVADVADAVNVPSHCLLVQAEGESMSAAHLNLKQLGPKQWNGGHPAAVFSIQLCRAAQDCGKKQEGANPPAPPATLNRG